MPFYKSYSERRVSFFGTWLNKRFAGRIVAMVDRWCSSGHRVVEIGPGDGRVARALARRYRYTGYEPAPESARKLRELNLDIKDSFVPPLSEEDCSQNAIIASHVLEHMADHRTVYALCRELLRVLKPGGVAVIVCPDAYDLGTLFFDIDYSHGYVTTPSRMTQLLRDSGFLVKERGMLYGALPTIPGMFLNWIVRAAFLPLGFAARHFCFERKGFLKIENLFSRVFWIIAQKPGDAA